jgi:hypothetical protein
MCRSLLHSATMDPEVAGETGDRAASGLVSNLAHCSLVPLSPLSPLPLSWPRLALSSVAHHLSIHSSVSELVRAHGSLAGIAWIFGMQPSNVTVSVALETGGLDQDIQKSGSVSAAQRRPDVLRAAVISISPAEWRRLRTSVCSHQSRCPDSRMATVRGGRQRSHQDRTAQADEVKREPVTVLTTSCGHKAGAAQRYQQPRL